RHRRALPPPHPRPRPPLPRHRTTIRLTTPKTTTARHLMQVRAVRDVLRHHRAPSAGFEPAHTVPEADALSALADAPVGAGPVRQRWTGRVRATCGKPLL